MGYAGYGQRLGLGALLAMSCWAAPLWAANLTVQILERGSGTPVAGAAVCLGTGADPSQFGALRSSADGTVQFEDILDAPLSLTVSKTGFRGERRDLAGMRSDRVLTVLLPRGGLGPRCDAPSGGDDAPGLTISNFRLDGGAASTQRRRVTLDFRTAGDATHYRASESQDFAGAPWQPLNDQPMFELSAGGGEKRVYLQVRKRRQTEGVSLETSSEIVSDSIDLLR